MQEIVIHNWDELQHAIFDGVWDADILRYRDNRVYRGMADARWGLVPSLNRVCAHDMSLERQMLRSFRKYGYADLQLVSSFWQMLAMAQQFGLPTRLLDWTYSPLVAAHFATEDQETYDRDGIIWCVQIDRMNQQLPRPSSICCRPSAGTSSPWKCWIGWATALMRSGPYRPSPSRSFSSPPPL